MVQVEIKNKAGLHARPAAQFCTLVKKYSAKITITKSEKSFDAKSVLMIMSAGIEYGDQITIEAVGSDARQAEEELAAFLNTLED